MLGHASSLPSTGRYDRNFDLASIYRAPERARGRAETPFSRCEYNSVGGATVTFVHINGRLCSPNDFSFSLSAPLLSLFFFFFPRPIVKGPSRAGSVTVDRTTGSPVCERTVGSLLLSSSGSTSHVGRRLGREGCARALPRPSCCLLPPPPPPASALFFPARNEATPEIGRNA